MIGHPPRVCRGPRPPLLLLFPIAVAAAGASAPAGEPGPPRRARPAESASESFLRRIGEDDDNVECIDDGTAGETNCFETGFWHRKLGRPDGAPEAEAEIIYDLFHKQPDDLNGYRWMLIPEHKKCTRGVCECTRVNMLGCQCSLVATAVPGSTNTRERDASYDVTRAPSDDTIFVSQDNTDWTKSTTGTTVMCAVSVSKVGPLHLKRKMIDISFDLRLQWNDPRLRWCPDNYTGYGATSTKDEPYISVIDHIDSEHIWTPDIFFMNGEELRKQDHTEVTNWGMETTRIRYDGEVFWTRKVIGTFNCPMKFEQYPFDKQVCTVEIQSFGYGTDAMQLVLGWEDVNGLRGLRSDAATPLRLDPNVIPDSIERVGAFKLTLLAAQNTTRYDIAAPWYGRSEKVPAVRFAFFLQRMTGPYYLSAFSQLWIVVAVSFLGSALSLNKPGPRMAAGITTVLVMFTLIRNLSVDLPLTGQLTDMEMHIICCLIIAFCNVLSFAFVNLISKQLEDHEQKLNAKRANRNLMKEAVTKSISQHDKDNERKGQAKEVSGSDWDKCRKTAKAPLHEAGGVPEAAFNEVGVSHHSALNRGDKSPKAKEDQLFCPAGHALQRVKCGFGAGQTGAAAHSCDRCYAREVTGEVWRCGACSYIVCPSCAALGSSELQTARSPASPREAGDARWERAASTADPAGVRRDALGEAPSVDRHRHSHHQPPHPGDAESASLKPRRRGGKRRSLSSEEEDVPTDPVPWAQKFWGPTEHDTGLLGSFGVEPGVEPANGRPAQHARQSPVAGIGEVLHALNPRGLSALPWRAKDAAGRYLIDRAERWGIAEQDMSLWWQQYVYQDPDSVFGCAELWSDRVTCDPARFWRFVERRAEGEGRGSFLSAAAADLLRGARPAPPAGDAAPRLPRAHSLPTPAPPARRAPTAVGYESPLRLPPAAAAPAPYAEHRAPPYADRRRSTHAETPPNPLLRPAATAPASADLSQPFLHRDLRSPFAPTPHNPPGSPSNAPYRSTSAPQSPRRKAKSKPGDKRIDPRDGLAKTKRQFIDRYGSLAEWEHAGHGAGQLKVAKLRQERMQEFICLIEETEQALDHDGEYVARDWQGEDFDIRDDVLTSLLTASGCSLAQQVRAREIIDSNKDGVVTFYEFWGFMESSIDDQRVQQTTVTSLDMYFCGFICVLTARRLRRGEVVFKAVLFAFFMIWNMYFFLQDRDQNMPDWMYITQCGYAPLIKDVCAATVPPSCEYDPGVCKQS